MIQVAVRDVIYIEANSGAVKRVGRSDAFATEFDLEAEEYVPLPKGEVHKKKEIVQVFDLKTIIILRVMLVLARNNIPSNVLCCVVTVASHFSIKPPIFPAKLKSYGVHAS